MFRIRNTLQQSRFVQCNAVRCMGGLDRNSCVQFCVLVQHTQSNDVFHWRYLRADVFVRGCLRIVFSHILAQVEPRTETFIATTLRW